MSNPRKLPRRIGDVLMFGKTVKLTRSKKEGVNQTSRFLLVARESQAKGGGVNRYFWTLANPDTGMVYESSFRESVLVKDVFMTKVYRASRGFYPLKSTSTKENQQ